MNFFSRKIFLPFVGIAFLVSLAACADVTVPDGRNVNIPAPVMADKRKQAVNERPDSVMYLPLGDDFLTPEVMSGDAMPTEAVGPFELRSETLAGALQLILAEYDISIAFETEEGLTRRVTVANLRGNLDRVVRRVCSLADLYCSFEDGTLVVKDTETFTVTLPPIGADTDDTSFIDDVASGLEAVLQGSGESEVTVNTDPSTRTIIYSATQRTSEMAERYFQRLRANTALIVFETYIWEVSLNAGNSTGIDWEKIDTFGKFNASVNIDGAVGADFTSPVSIGLPTTQAIGATPTDLIQFLSQFGAVKTISQPQVTVLSGSAAELRVADTQNYVSEISTTLADSGSTTSVSTDSVDSGFTLTIGSTWDKSTVYANIGVTLENVVAIDNFTFSDGGDNGTSTTIQLPQTSERELTTQIRVRPGDSILIAGLVRESDSFDSRGPGFMEPVLPDSRTATTQNLELVILLRPRVVAYTGADDSRYKDYVAGKDKQRQVAREEKSAPATDMGTSSLLYAPEKRYPSAVSEKTEWEPVSGKNIYNQAAPVEPSAPAMVEPVSATASPVMPVESISPSPVYAAPSPAPAYVAPAQPSVPAAPPQEELYVPYSSNRYGSGYVSRSVDEVPSQPSYEPPAAVSAPAPVYEDYGYSGSGQGYETYDAYEGGDSVEIYQQPSQNAPTNITGGQPYGQTNGGYGTYENPVNEPSTYETYDYYSPTY